MSSAPPRSPRRRRLRRAGIVLAVLVAVWTAFGFLAAPAILKRVLVTQATAALRRGVSVARVRVNPLVLSVTVEGLDVRHRDGTPFVGWDSLYVRLAPWRILAGDLGVGEVRLVRPSVHVGMGKDGSLSFEDLLSAGEKPAATPAPPAREGGLGVSIGRLAIEEARIAFHDATRSPEFETTLGPVTIRLESFRTKGGGDSPYAFAGASESGEVFRWAGTVRTQPIRSAGTLAFERVNLPKYGAYLHDQAPVDLRDGLLDADLRYELEWGADRRVVRLSEGKVTVERLAVGVRGGADAPVSLQRLEVTGIEADALARQAKVGEVAIRGGRLLVRREADGKLELARLTPAASRTSSTAAAAATPQATATAAPPPAPFSWSVGALSVTDVALTWEDHAPPRPVSLPLTDVTVRLEALRSAPGAASPLTASLTWNGAGKLRVSGPLKPLAAQGAITLEATDLDLAPLAPYLEPAVAAQLAAGRAGAKLRIGFDASGRAPRWMVAGDARIDGLAVTEAGNVDLLRWRALETIGIDAASTPPRASVKLVRLVEPRAKVYVWEDGTTSLARARPAPATGAASPSPAPSAEAAPAWRTSIGAVQLVRGRATLVDRSVTPAAVLNLTGADASVTSLSSDPKIRSTVDVRLEVEGSPIRVEGTLNPLQKEAHTRLTVSSQGVDLSPLDPYAGKFLGYGIAKGKLDLDLRYEILDRVLAATNVVKVNQLSLGEATDSKDATRIPVRLALALLQDKDGVILLDVPVEGKLDDPEFHLGRVIWRTILNVLVKVATSPFRALAALAGGGDADLSMVEFSPGSAEPLPAAQERIALLARSLAQRPAVGLELEGSADEAADGPALRRAALERSLRAAKAASMRPPPASLEAILLAPEERERLVRAAYEAASAAAPPPARKPGEPAPPPPTLPQMEEWLAARAELAPDVLRTLAAERAQRARAALAAAGVDVARLFLAQGGARAGTEKGARVYLNVR